MAKKKKLSSKKLAELKVAREQVLIWAFREIAFLYQLRAVSAFKEIADRMMKTEDRQALIDFVTFGDCYYVYLSVADTIVTGAGAEFNAAASRLPDLVRKANCLDPEAPYAEIRDELLSIVKQLSAAQSHLPLAYVCMSNHPHIKLALRKFGPHFRPPSRSDFEVIPDSMVNVILAIIDACSAAIHSTQTKDQAKGNSWSPAERYKKMVAILVEQVSDLLGDPTTVSHLGTSLKVLQLIEA